MGNKYSLVSDSSTAKELYYKESAIKGIKAVSAAGASIVLSPLVIIALPIVGAYEFSTSLGNELITGYKIMDGMIGGLLGVVASPLAPFYCFLLSIQEIFELEQPSKSKSTRKHVKRATGMLRLDSNFYNIVVAGCPGTGKSSIVNGFLGYKENHVNSAPVGEIETTIEPKRYRHPLLKTLCIWDMPGIGTPRHPAKNFFDNYCLAAFDAILIVFDDRLMASDVDIARKAKKYKIPVFFIKSKADLSIEKKIQRMKSGSDTEKWARAVSKLSSEVKHSVCKNMKQFGLDTNQLYLVSANCLQDFVVQLQQDTADTLPHKQINKLIHEKVLITNLLDSIAKRTHTDTKDSDVYSSSGSESTIYI